MDFETLLKMGLDRDLPKLREAPKGLSVGLGETGVKNYGVDLCLGLPNWRWPRDNIPADDETVGIIHAYHFF